MNNVNSQEMQPSIRLSLRMCALCPSPCRSMWPEDLPTPLESELPSGLALLAMSVMEGYIEPDKEVQHALHFNRGALQCAKACVYTIDIVDVLQQVCGKQTLVDQK